MTRVQQLPASAYKMYSPRAALLIAHLSAVRDIGLSNHRRSFTSWPTSQTIPKTWTLPNPGEPYILDVFNEISSWVYLSEIAGGQDIVAATDKAEPAAEATASVAAGAPPEASWAALLVYPEL